MLVRHYYKRLDVPDAMIHLAMAGNLLRQLTYRFSLDVMANGKPAISPPC